MGLLDYNIGLIGLLHLGYAGWIITQQREALKILDEELQTTPPEVDCPFVAVFTRAWRLSVPILYLDNVPTSGRRSQWDTWRLRLQERDFMGGDAQERERRGMEKLSSS
ncbi:hypothetical protein CBR_g26333 [Chara braunii]|uniref:Uncharacterized protein n=1 Tax=Chara braunii TaxID=69332 RepID=A0A388L7X7_CHABU|nr:hypothetical protein CBR_g26333 [Chara braunii]|eukprot:GBG78303.1 hypothetical protein CBR_g26333 [Chara braunii]